MARKQWVLLALFIALAAVYIFAFTNCGRRSAMQISHAAYANPKGLIRPRLRANRMNTANVIFNLDHAYRLTEVKVVRLADWQTNKSTLPLWHVISDSNSIPTRRFSYGAPIRGMKSSLPGVRPEPLATNVIYHLFLTAGSDKGQHDFSLPPK
jgi:hypothetical protein